MTPTIINEPFESTVTFAETAHKQVRTHTHTHIYLSHLFTGDLGNDGRLNVADGTSHSIQILFFFSTLSRSFKKSVQGQASSVNRAGIWFQIRRQNEGAHEVLSDVRKPSATPGFCFLFGAASIPDNVAVSREKGREGFPGILWISCVVDIKGQKHQASQCDDRRFNESP